ncbi:MAG: PCRF domain-containing protein, partial [Flammeovirgaceae bacterium]|nr:PCRF domain-containing protein [Flammeovirgaceae bacterium]MDW8286483.1 PCRF domain-containing protein [Flammeovirgaceae bacterium]
MNLVEKLESIKKRFDEVAELVVQPDVVADIEKFAKLNKEYKELNKIVEVYGAYKNVLDNLTNAKNVLETEHDAEFRELAKAELDTLGKEKETLEEKLKEMLIPKDPNDSKNAIVEIRAGTGGDEASLFAGDLFRMYQRFAEMQGWKVEVTDFTEGTAGGYKEIIFTVSGEDVYGKLKYESGVHRVQRVPATETQGRIHTSAASVAVLPEAEEFDVKIDMNDIRKDTYCSSGPGGQS